MEKEKEKSAFFFSSFAKDGTAWDDPELVPQSRKWMEQYNNQPVGALRYDTHQQSTHLGEEEEEEEEEEETSFFSSSFDAMYNHCNRSRLSMYPMDVAPVDSAKALENDGIEKKAVDVTARKGGEERRREEKRGGDILLLLLL